MKFHIIFGSLFVGFCSYSYAGCVGPVVMGNCVSGTNINGYESSDESRAKRDSDYQGSSGARYQYDLSNPVDRTRYSTDIDAQRRDQMNIDMRRNLDRSKGQQGGGIYDD